MTYKPRMPRADLSRPSDSYTSRLNSAVTASPEHVTWHRPEHRSDSIEPDEGLRASYLNGLRLGGGHE